jgi:hypothetical protein
MLCKIWGFHEYEECHLLGCDDVALVRAEDSEEFIASIVRVKIISEVGTLVLACSFFYPDDGCDKFVRNVGSYKSHMASQPRRQHSSS